MDQKKIGEFIAALRKEKNMTQAELAERLGVSNKAVSKWETGKGMPDISLLKPLSDILGVTVHELLNGEISDDAQKQEQAEETVINLLKVIQKSDKLKNLFIGGMLTLIGFTLTGSGVRLQQVSEAVQFMDGLSTGLSSGLILVGVYFLVSGISKLP